jgi:hypothetical protein
MLQYYKANRTSYALLGVSSLEKHASICGSSKKYAEAGLSITPKPKLSDRQIIEAFVRGRGLDPQQVLRHEAFAEPHRLDTTEEEKRWRTRRSSKPS